MEKITVTGLGKLKKKHFADVKRQFREKKNVESQLL